MMLYLTFSICLIELAAIAYLFLKSREIDDLDALITILKRRINNNSELIGLTHELIDGNKKLSEKRHDICLALFRDNADALVQVKKICEETNDCMEKLSQQLFLIKDEIDSLKGDDKDGDTWETEEGREEISTIQAETVSTGIADPEDSCEQ